MTSARRLVPTAIVTLALLLVPILGTSAAHGAGTGSPAIVTPADGASYYSHEVPHFVVDFGGAPYGSYDWSVSDSTSNQVLHSGTFTYDASDPDQNDLTALGDLGLGGYTATVTSTGGTVTSSFGTYELGPPPQECQIQVRAAVRVVSPSTAVYPRFVDCQGQTATWAIRQRAGSTTLGAFKVVGGSSAGPWLFHDSWHTGGYDVVARGGGNDTATVVRFGSRISLNAGARSGNRIPLSGNVTRYVASADGFHAWADRPVAIAYKNCAAGCRWRYLATTRSDAHGHFALTAISSTVRYWHATVGNTTSVWGRTSAAVKR